MAGPAPVASCTLPGNSSGPDDAPSSQAGSSRAGEPGYRTRQVADAVWRTGAAAASDARDPAGDPARGPTESFRWDTVASSELVTSDGGTTEKALHRLSDGLDDRVRADALPGAGRRRERHTLCISSQAGCAVGCPFCATGELGFERDLETAEIVDQVAPAARRARGDGARLTNVVFMGMGEPLLNLDRVLAAVEALNDPARFGLGARHITVSTSGVVPGHPAPDGAGPQFTLAVSLHAARDALRDVLVPLNRRWPVGRGRRRGARACPHDGPTVSYEVTMIGGVNDTDPDATARDAPAGRPRARQPDPHEPVAHTPWTASPMPVIERFAARARGGRDPVDDPAQPGPGDRRGLRTARGRRAAARAPAVARRRRRLEAASAAALRGERSGRAVPAGVE